jgi:hypothetical protein
VSGVLPEDLWLEVVARLVDRNRVTHVPNEP